MSIITTFENQCRALTTLTSRDENASRFLVGTLSPNSENFLHLFEYKDDNKSLAKVSLNFPFGESWHLSTSTKFPNLVANVVGNQGKSSVSIFKLPDDLKNSIDDDYGLSELPIEKLYEPVGEAKDLTRQSHWHPDDGHQLLTCDAGSLQFWDVDQQKLARSFSLSNISEDFLNLDTSNPKFHKIIDLRWSLLFNSSVVGAAIGSRILGIDTRIPESSPAFICWLIEDQRCSRVHSIDFNPNSQYYLASGGEDCRANFWDLRQTVSPVLYMRSHTHWIQNIRYNPFHDQLVLSAGSDARVVLMRALSTASEPYGQLGDDDVDDIKDEEDDDEIYDNKTEDCNNKEKTESPKESTDTDLSIERSKEDKKPLKDEVINVYEVHDDSVYSVVWATDPWIFASLGFESRLVINRVPKVEKFNILF